MSTLTLRGSLDEEAEWKKWRRSTGAPVGDPSGSAATNPAFPEPQLETDQYPPAYIPPYQRGARVQVFPHGDSDSNDTPDEGWNTVYDRLKKHDTAMIDGYAADMDTLLIFAGLFSAVLTALLIEVYTQLQPDNSQLTVNILSEIYKQVHNISDGTTATNSTLASATAFSVARSTVVINALWFLSLILSLAAALFAIFVKQWLREYLHWTTLSPVREAVHLRQYRFEAFQTWRIPGIATSLPALLQVALILFFVGLLILLWTLHTAVALVATVASGLGLLCILAWIILPVATDTCPYKTPLAWAILRGSHATHLLLLRVTRRTPGLSKVVSAIVLVLRCIASVTSTCLVSAKNAHRRCRNWIQSQRNRFILEYRHLWSWAFPSPRPLDDEQRQTDGRNNPYTISNTKVQLPRRHARYDHFNWCRRDYALSLTSLGRDPVRLSAWRCRSLLWTATYEDLLVTTALRCTADFFSPSRDLPQITSPKSDPSKSNKPDSNPAEIDGLRDDPYRYVCAYWLAIQQFLGYGTENVALLESIEHIYIEGRSSEFNALLSAHQRFQELQEQLAQLDARPREIMFHLLRSGIDYALDHNQGFDNSSGNSLARPPFTKKDMNRLALASLFMMRLLCHRWSGLHPAYFGIMFRVLAHGLNLRWAALDSGGTRNPSCCITFLNDATAHLSFVDCSVEELIVLASSASIFFNEGQIHLLDERKRFFSVVNAVLCLQPAGQEDTPSYNQYLLLVRTLLQNVERALAAMLAVVRSPLDPLNRDIRQSQLWTRLIPFCERHPAHVPPALDETLKTAIIHEHIFVNVHDPLLGAWVSLEHTVAVPVALPFFIAHLNDQLAGRMMPSIRPSHHDSAYPSDLPYKSPIITGSDTSSSIRPSYMNSTYPSDLPYKPAVITDSDTSSYCSAASDRSSSTT